MSAAYVELLGALSTSGVEYAIVGGLAVVLHGVPRMTFDLDLAVDPATSNMERMVRVLIDGGYRARIPEPIERLADPEARRAWREERNMIAFNVHHPLRRLEDVDLLLLDVADWGAIVVTRERRRLGPIEVPVIGADALAKMKRASGRPQDLADADALEALGRRGT